MAKTNWQDPKTGEIISPHISGLQEAVGKIEESIGIESVTENNIPLLEVFISNDDRCRIYQAPEGKRNWLLSPTPVIKKNGTIITADFEIDYGGGAIVFTTPLLPSDSLTADVTYTKKIVGKQLSTEDYTTIEKAKLAGIANNANNYVHPTTAGNKHIPTGGSVGQILKNTASGTATWQNETITPIANNLTTTVAGSALDATQGKVLKDALTTHKADLAYQTPIIVGTQIKISKQSDTNRLYFKLDTDLTGGAITISTDNGATSKPLKDFEGTQLIELEKGFVEVIADASFFTLRPRGSKLEIGGQDIVNATYQDTINKFDPVFIEYNRTGYSTKLPNPSELPSGMCWGVEFSPDDKYIATTSNNSPYLIIYKRDGDAFTKLPNPTSLPTSACRGVSFSNNGKYLAVTMISSPYIMIYKRNGDVFTKLPNPSALPTGIGWGIDFSPDDKYMVVAHSTSPYITIYERNDNTFTKLSNPAMLPTNRGISVKFMYDGTSFILSQESGANTIYTFIGGIFEGRSILGSTAPSGSATGVGYIKKNNMLCFCTYTIYDKFSTYKAEIAQNLIRVQNIDVLPNSASNDLDISVDENYVAVVFESSPYVMLYKRNGDTFTKATDASILPTGNAYGVAFSNDGEFMAVVHNTSPYITIYKASEITPKVFNAINRMNDINDKDGLGYALEDGVAGNEKKIVRLWR